MLSRKILGIKMMIDFEILPHTADIKIRVYGKSKQELFRNSLVGMFQAIHPIVLGCSIENGRVVCLTLPERHDISIEAADIESLMVDFLSEALYLSDVHNEAYLDVIIHEYTDTYINATLCGVRVTGFEVVEIKAVTYHELEIKKHNDVWQADIVFDI
jgi:SHS2 domain-containing protein